MLPLGRRIDDARLVPVVLLVACCLFEVIFVVSSDVDRLIYLYVLDGMNQVMQVELCRLTIILD